MAVVVSFSEYRPTPRYDGLPWTKVLIEEAAAAAGPWTLIDTITLNPVEPNPADPLFRSFSTALATLDNGWYRVSFEDAVNNRLYTDPMHNVEPPQQPWLPSIKDVALKILSRTRDSFGNEQGTFTSNTRPTDEQVADIINRAAQTVADEVGDDLPSAVYGSAKNVVAIRAAMQIELAYFSDQVNTGRSIYPQLESEYKSETMALGRAAVAANDSGDGSVRQDESTASAASYSFPDAGIGFSTVW